MKTKIQIKIWKKRELMIYFASLLKQTKGIWERN